jgi:hypothetical protein
MAGKYPNSSGGCYSKSPGLVLSLKKNPACPKLTQAEQIAFEIEEFFPAGRFLY